MIDARRPGAAPRRASLLARLITTLVAVLVAIGVVAAQGACGVGDGGSGVGADDPVVADDPRFDVAWRLVAERYWDLSRVPVDWDEAGARYGAWPRTDDGAVDRALEALYAELGDDHSRYVPADEVAAVREELGDLPCVGVFGLSTGAAQPLPTAWAFAQAGGAFRAARSDDAPAELRWSGPVGYGVYPDGVGYVRVADLVRSGTAEGLRTAVRTLDGEGARALVLDLRSNPGGRLVTMMQAAGVFTRGFLWRALTRWSFPLPYPAIGTPATDLPLAVLVDGDVHSAAEGLAGALQANGRALVVGATTAGNVEAVLPFCLRDGAQAWLATGVLAPLLGPTWEGRGVGPDLPTAADRAVEAARAALTRP
ncbi:MAG: S41 family peptidase [Trueperaceae bacterium]|nr:S41 family peptidase [Trueperaceae bacterium]